MKAFVSIHHGVGDFVGCSIDYPRVFVRALRRGSPRPVFADPSSHLCSGSTVHLSIVRLDTRSHPMPGASVPGSIVVISRSILVFQFKAYPMAFPTRRSFSPGRFELPTESRQSSSLVNLGSSRAGTKVAESRGKSQKVAESRRAWKASRQTGWHRALAGVQCHGS